MYFTTKFLPLSENSGNMELRVKEILKQKGLRMADLADRMGTNQSNLQKSLSRNPTIQTLQDVAAALNVQLGELFPASTMTPTAKSLLMMDGRTYGIVPMQNIVNIPHYTYFPKLHDDVKVFIVNTLRKETNDSICGILDAVELFCLSFNKNARTFTLSICHENARMLTYCYDVLEYGPENIDTELLLNDILDDIEGAGPFKTGKGQDVADEPSQ